MIILFSLISKLMGADTMSEIGIVAFKLLLAAIAGLVLGLEREAKHKALGLKTCVVIAIASCLLTIVSIEFALNASKGAFSTSADPMRLAAQIVTGVGFLGAGVILRRESNVISGLTTAAIVWAASGFGIGIGAGFYYEVAIAVVLVYLTVSFLPLIMRKIGPMSLKEQEASLNILVDPSVLINTVVEEIEALVISIENVKIKGNEDGHQLEMHCFIDDKKGSIYYQYEEISKITGVNQVEITKV